jgi:signal transduction histidine kinase
MAKLEGMINADDGDSSPVDLDLASSDAVACLRREVHELRQALIQRDAFKNTLATELQDMWRIHEMSTRLAEATNLPRMLEEILDAAIALQDADFGNIQLYDSATDTMRIAVHRGFTREFLDHFQSVSGNDGSVCGRALRARARMIVEDVEQDEEFEPHRAIAADVGFRAVQCTPLFAQSGTVKGMLSTHFRAPHQFSQRELRLTDLYLRLASEMIERAQIKEALHAARQAADEANRAKDRFLATASHDLRQPLQTLYFLNLVLRRMISDPDAGEVIAGQEKAIGSMSELLNALLDISKLESGAVEPQVGDVALAPLFDELRLEFSPLAQSKGVHFEIGMCGEMVVTDPALLSQILRNLLSNAIRYTRIGFVRLQCEREGEQVRIDVEDTGIGIAEEYLPRIFDEFYQVGITPNSVREGSGLGLSIVRRLVRLLKHHMRVHSRFGQGSVFSVVLPASSISPG